MSQNGPTYIKWNLTKNGSLLPKITHICGKETKFQNRIDTPVCLRLQLRCWEAPGAPKCPPDPPGQVFDNVSVNTDINYLCPRPGSPRQKTSVSYLAGNWNQQKWLMVPPEWVARKSGIRFQNAAKTRIFHHNWQPPQKCHSRRSQKVSRAAALRPVAAVTFLRWDGDIINSTFYRTFKITIS